MEKNIEQNKQKNGRKSDLEQIYEVMTAAAVEFIVIGGQAETLMGSPRITYDVDLCYLRPRKICLGWQSR